MGNEAQSGRSKPGSGFGTKAAIVIVLAVVLGVLVYQKQRTRKQMSPEGAQATAPPVTTVPRTEQPARAGEETNQPETTIPLLLDLGADKCIPCKMMAPILLELKKEYAGKLQVEVIDVWKNPDAGQQYGIRIIPTQIFYDASRRELFRHEGFMSKQDILAKWKELGFHLPAPSPEPEGK